MKKNVEKREWSDGEKLVIGIAIYCIITLLIRWFVPEIPKWCVGLHVPMNQAPYWINLFQTPMYVINILLIVVSILVAIAAAWVAIVLPIFVIMGVWEILRMFYNLIAHISPLPYCELASGEIFECEKFRQIIVTISVVCGFVIFIVSCVYHVNMYF